MTLITGASSGIGLELARVFAKNQHALILVARSTELLEKLAAELRATYHVEVQVVTSDLAKVSSPEELFQLCQSKGWQVDVLVNNAGVGDNAAFADTFWAKQEMMIDLNMKSLAHLTHLFLPAMLKRRQGSILNVASTAAFQPGPYMAVYYASKSFVLSFSEALSEELSGSGVYVTALCPGPTTSGFLKAAGMDESWILKMKIPTSEDVAIYAYKAWQAHKRVAIHGLLNSVIAFSTRLVPTGLVLKVVSMLQKKRLKK